MIRFRQYKSRPHSYPRETSSRVVRRFKGGKRVRMKRGQVAMEIACCDCCLVHGMILTIRRDRVWVRAWREEETTAAYRKQNRVKIKSR